MQGMASRSGGCQARSGPKQSAAAEQQTPQQSAVPPVLLPALPRATGCQVGGRHALGAMDCLLVSGQGQVSGLLLLMIVTAAAWQ